MTHQIQQEQQQSEVSVAYRNYVLLLLVVVYMFNFIDRNIVSILMPFLKADLGLSDTQLGFLSGFSFAIFYVTFGIPIARLADRRNRTTIIAVSVGLWSAMTAVCGLAQNYIQLALARVGVGIGEAGCTPPAQSLLADYFPPASRPLVFAIYSMGAPIGAGLGFLLGGWIAEAYGWKMTFMVLGLPGLLLALLVKFTLREPVRGGMDSSKKETINTASEKGTSSITNDDQNQTLWQALAGLWRIKSFRHLTMAASLASLVSYGLDTWLPSLFSRSFAWNMADIGSLLAALNIVGGSLGILIGGWLGSKYLLRDVRWLCYIPIIGMLAMIPFRMIAYLAPTGMQAALWLILPSILITMSAGPVFALVQHLVHLRSRALAIAVFFFFVNLIGLGAGPFIIGALSDISAILWGDAGLRNSMLLVLFIFAPLSALFFWLASRRIDGVITGKKHQAKQAVSSS